MRRCHTESVDSRTPDRVLRGVVAASAATAIALLGHVLAGGPAPGLAGLLVPWWLSVTLCTALAGRTVSLPRTAAAVLGSQLAFHLLFVLGSAGTGTVSLHMHHHGHGTPPSAAVDPVADGAVSDMTGAAGASTVHGSHAALHGAHLDAPMLLGHLAAAVLTIALLHRGERLLERAGAVGLTALDALTRCIVLVGWAVMPPRRSSARARRLRALVVPPRLRGRPAAAPDCGRSPPLILAV